MTDAPRHTSLEREFRAAVPLPRATLRSRVLWWLAFRLLSLRFVQRLVEKRYGT